MKKILITGANSYIGTSFEKYLARWTEDYQVDTVDMIDGTWREKSFAGYDAVFHVAGIAHVKETKNNKHLYDRVNRILAVETAKKAKNDGVGQFIFLSTMSVYGLVEGVITPETQPNPQNCYGKAKYEAEREISAMRNKNFCVAVLRPPMVYGDGCKGNYQSLIKLAKIAPVFPNYKNQRSMIHIDRLCMFVKRVVDNRADGVFMPQDDDYICTCEMVRQIAKSIGKNLRLWKILNPAVWLLKKCTTDGKKAFGDLVYTKEISDRSIDKKMEEIDFADE